MPHNSITPHSSHCVTKGDSLYPIQLRHVLVRVVRQQPGVIQVAHQARPQAQHARVGGSGGRLGAVH